MFKRYIDGYDRKSMAKVGLKYNKSLNKFSLEGYGVFLGNILECDFDDMYKELGYDLVIGPMVKTNINFNSEGIVGLYCKNYEDVYDKKEVYLDSDIVRDEVLKLSKIHKKASLKNSGTLLELVNHKINIFKNNVVDSLSDEDLYKVINEVNDTLNLVDFEDDIVNYFSDTLYKRIIKKEELIDTGKVNSLVLEARGLANELSNIRNHSFMSIYNPDKIFWNANGIVNLVQKVKDECSVWEIKELLQGLKSLDEDGEYIEGTEYMVLVLDSHIRSNIFDEYFEKGKVKEKKK